jgi:23S rRNA pseudouridine1911/1915/1917 synthase
MTLKNTEFSSIVSNIRIDRYLADIFNDFSRSHISKLILSGDIVVNGSNIKPSYILSVGDKIKFNLKPPKKISLEPENISLEIVYQDNYIAVVNKPSGMVVHPSAGHFDKTLVNALLYHLDNLSGINTELRPGIVHRLDKDTSGLMVVAKNDIAHINLSEQFKKRKVKKYYKALVHGRVYPESGRIESFIGRDPINRLKFSSNAKNGKIAITNYKTEKSFKKFTLLDINIETGRTHQIRVHFSEKGHPLAGDTLYGGKRSKLPVMRRVFLHSYKLVFFHPENNSEMKFEIGMPVELQNILRKLHENQKN